MYVSVFKPKILFEWMECKEKLKIMIEMEQVLMEEVKIFC